ncbi:MAG: esterase/lipase family protein [Planctomycetota bacterium]|jgi:triacylglycerol esterase/lipase EstA (alpha/beta hydrolase family)
MDGSKCKRKIASGVLLFCLIVSIAGCGSPYSAKKRNVTQLFKQRQKNALNSNEPSQLTQQYLRLENLTKQYKDDRVELIKRLSEKALGTQDLQTVRVLAELSLLEGRRRSSRHMEDAAALYMISAETSYHYLLAGEEPSARSVLDPSYRFVAEIYNIAVSELVRLHEIQDNPWKSHGTYSVGNTVYEFTLEKPSHEVWDPSFFDELIPAYEIETKGLRNEYHASGLGAPFIGVVKNPHETLKWGEFCSNNKAGYPVTALLLFEPSGMKGQQRHVKTKIIFYNALTRDEFSLEGMKIPLEVDYSTPLVIQMENINPFTLGLSSMFKSDKKIDSAGLFLLEPYNPNKIPVVMVHGLMSSSVTWIEMFNDLRGQPEIRDRYQFWFFSYPTGLPILYSSSILRENLLDVQQKLDPDSSNPNFNNMILVGHSMGGLLSRVMMQDSGDAYWDYVFAEPIDEIQIEEASRELLRQTLYFESIPFVQRVVFVSTPHRGSPIADRWYSSIASGMINLPANLVNTSQSLFSDKATLNQQVHQNTKKVKFRSIGSLSATSPFTTVYNQIPVREDVVYHSIIGTRKDDTGPGSSDGVVPYESSHIDFAVSERLVHFNHGAHQHPDAIDEVKRILLLHLEETEQGMQ